MGCCCNVRVYHSNLYVPIIADSSFEAFLILSPEKSVSEEPHLLKDISVILFV